MILRTIARALLAVALTTAALVATAGPAAADDGTQYVAWYAYPGFQSSWICNTTSTFDLKSEGYVYVQACVSQDGDYEQGLYNVRFSQPHLTAAIHVNEIFPTRGGSYRYPPDGFYDRVCGGQVNSGITMSCFAKTLYSNAPMFAEADGSTITIDGRTYPLTGATNGPTNQYTSPETYLNYA